MNYHDDDTLQYDESYDYNDQWLPQHDKASLSGVDLGPGRVYEVKTTETNEGEAQHRQQEGGDNTKKGVWATGPLGQKSWNIYVFMSVMAVLVFLMDASYRIMRAVHQLGPCS
ncbi:hypothetical protein Hamer_G028924 [Homarus americanus]|uniref:Uncharacterized protein n=1 Tax=Homarus americanus TaxID=6706 RepID=A0A8J5TNM7_HOMAM|nr:hypothetical protein Hamer_G028924 [Homarus americanus]